MTIAANPIAALALAEVGAAPTKAPPRPRLIVAKPDQYATPEPR